MFLTEKEIALVLALEGLLIESAYSGGRLRLELTWRFILCKYAPYADCLMHSYTLLWSRCRS